MAIVAVLCVSSGSLAGLVHQRFLAGRPEAFLVVHFAVMVAVSCLALLVADLPLVTHWPWASVAIGVPVGVACGIAAVQAELLVKRRARRRRRLAPPAGFSLGRSGPSSPDVGRMASVRTVSSLPRRVPSVLALLVLAAAFEEILFRGVAIDLARALPSSALNVAGVAAATACFAISHLPFGWADVTAKLPLGLLALATTLLFDSIAPALAAHVVFNAAIWRTLPPPPGEGAGDSGDRHPPVAGDRW